MPSGIQNVCMAEVGYAPDRDEIPPATLKSIKFNLMTSEEIEKSASIIIGEGSDLSSPRLGLPNPLATCETCGSYSIKNCDGHFGMIKLPRQIYHPYFLPEVVHILNQMCVGCKCIRNNIHMKESFSSRALKKPMDDLQIEKIYNALSDIQKKLLSKVVPSSKFLKAHLVSKKKSLKNLLKRELRDQQLDCKYCHTQGHSDEWYPKVKFKIMKEKYGSKNVYIVAEVNEKLPKKFKSKCLGDAIARDFWDFVPGSMNDSEVHDRTKMVLSPFQAFYLLKELDKDFIETLVPRRDLVFISCVPVTSNCHRVSEVVLPHGNGPQLVFDQRTAAYRSLLNSKRKIDDLQLHLPTYSAGICKIVSSHFFNCLSSSNLYGSSTMSMKLDSSQSGLKWLKDVVIGKRSDHTFNMVVVGDPKIKLGEIGIPRNVSGRLVISEYITAFNHEKLKSGCNLKLFQRTGDFSEKKRGSRSKPTIGDIAHRPLEDGDTILAYRPPSVHHHSLIALRVKILPVNSAVSINPLCCAPFKGDFDGDILFGFIPQSVQCRIELDQLVRLDCQLFNNQDGRNLLSLSHDSLTAAHLLMGAYTFLNKIQMQQLQMFCPQKVVCPAVLKSLSSHMPLWTGWQLFSSLLPQSLDYVSESGTCISNGEVLLSPTESLWLQNTNDGFFSTLFKCYGRKGLDTLFTMQEMLCEWISSRGFSVSLNDLYICADQLLREKMIMEVTSGLQHAKHAFHVRSLMLDPEMINFYNHLSDHQDFSCITRSKKDNLKRTKMNLGVHKLHSVSAFTEVFQDTRTIIHHYAHRKNSFLQMIHAGSKGNFTKLFQQAVCLGLLNSTSSFPFEISQGLHTNEISGPSYTLCCEGKNVYGFIGNSFLEGLNPRECLFHAISARPNFFSENAELPGTLNRKLMFYMRDLYAAYDGSVRNLYGQQIVQFLYDIPEKTQHYSNGTHKLLNDLHVPQPQEPIGVLAASAVSEAAYGGLDQPTLGKSSPLMNLKKLLNSSQRSSLGGQIISLALSKKLRRWNYGFEYGALEVQRHLERVFLSDITKTVLILYTRDVAESVSPWVSHFHLSKKEMIQRRMTLQSVIDVLEKKYSLAEETQEQVSCKLNFFAGKCSLTDGVAGCKRSKCLLTDVACDNSLYTDVETGCKCRKCLLTADRLRCKCRKCLFSDVENDCGYRECLLTDNEEGCHDTLCLTITMESSEFETRFDDLRDILVPFLLQTVVRGFKEYKKVEILWDDDPNSTSLGKDRFGELSVKVSLSEYCTAKSWTDLQCACIPIMGLIDWERSHPDSVWDIHNSHGIECAWEFFLKTLKTATTSLGRTIKEQHLLLVADCLTATGQFSGLSAKGIKLQRKYFSISSPFMLGCSYRPADTFVNAAKKGATDNLLGTTDAMAWGVEAPIGTGGSFDILFSGKKFDDHGKLENIYQSLVGHSVLENNDTFVGRPSTSSSNKWESWSHFEDGESGNPRSKFEQYGAQKRNKNLDKIFSKRNRRPVSGCSSDAEIVNMYRRLQNILHRSPINSLLDMHESSFVLDALLFHPDCLAKIGTGAQDIKIGYHPSFPKSRCFFVLRKDGTSEDFSFKKCVIGASKKHLADCDAIEEKRSFAKHSSKRS